MSIEAESDFEQEIIDVTNIFKDRNDSVVRAEKRGLDVLILCKLDDPVKRFDKTWAKFRLEHRWLSREDPDLVCVRGSDCTYWTQRELQAEKGLFDQFQLF